jgi:hypothetical protein
MDFKLIAKLVELKTARITQRAYGATRKNYELIFSPFRFDYATGAVASQSVAVYSVPINIAWAIRYPVRPPSTSFVAVVAFKSGTSVRRYKLWSDVGERLSIPKYLGEALPAGTVIEIWTVPDQTPLLGFQWKLPLGLLQLPTSPSDMSGDDIIPTLCAPSYPPPTTVNGLFTTCTY